MSVIEGTPVSNEVIDRIRRESRGLMRGADELSAQLETGRFEASTDTAARLRRRLRTHLSLVDAVLDAMTLDHCPRSGAAFRGKRLALPSDFVEARLSGGPDASRAPRKE